MNTSTANTAAKRASRGANTTHRWMRQFHLWVGAWGALAAILFGVSGFLQNHRSVLKLPQGETTEISRMDVDVPEAARATPEALRDWLRDAQHIPVESARIQGAGEGARGRGGDNARTVAEGRAGVRWVLLGGNARTVWNAEYTPGSLTVQVRNSERSALAILASLHKGVGGGVAWILLSDSFALGMALLGISGIWMWARGRSIKQMVLSVLGAGLLVLVLIGGSAMA